MRIATCTPVDFKADDHFFSRDSGLLCRGFQEAGHACQSIMPGQAASGDAPDLLRCHPRDLASPDWWRERALDLVVLYAWGDPAYHDIARAIRTAGIRLIQSLDTAGLPSPYADFATWLAWTLGMIGLPQPGKQKLRLVAKAVRDFVPAFYDKKRAMMLDECDELAAVSPPAFESIAAYVRAMGRPHIERKLAVVPHPVSPRFAYRGTPKKPIVVAVGRWDEASAAQKDPRMTVDVIGDLLSARPDWDAVIIGRGATALLDLTSGWSPRDRERIALHEFLDHPALVRHLDEASIMLCASRYESYHISSAEAVCCGCSVVVADHPLLASTAWFTTASCGTLSPARTRQALANALSAEAEAWSTGHRNPSAISQAWCSRLHAPEVARRLAEGVAGVHP